MPTYSITLSGDADPDDAEEVFQNATRALRTIATEGTVVDGGLTTDSGANVPAGGVPDTTEPADAGDEGDGADV